MGSEFSLKNIKLFVDGEEIPGVESANIQYHQDHEDFSIDGGIISYRAPVMAPQYTLNVQTKKNKPIAIQYPFFKGAKENKMTSAKDLRTQAKKMLEEAALLESRPIDDFEVGAVLVFDKQFGLNEPTYTYTAIKTNRSVTPWLISGTKYSSYTNWNETLDFAERDGGTVNGLYLVTELKEVKYK